MITAFTIAAALGASILASLLLVIHTRSDIRFLRGTSFIAGVLAAFTAAVIAVNLLSFPTLPIIGLTLPRDALIDVVGFKLEPDVRITVMLDVPDGPRLYEYAWDKRKAEEMQKAQEGEQKLQVSTFEKKGGEGKLGSDRAPRLSPPGDIVTQDMSIDALPLKDKTTTRTFTVD